VPDVPEPLSAEEQQQLIAQELDKENDPAFMQFIMAWWPHYAVYARLDFHLPMLYVKRRAIGWLKGRLRTARDWKNADQQQKDSQLLKTLTDMDKEIQEEIDVIVGRTSSRPPVMGGLIVGRIPTGGGGSPLIPP